MKKVYRYTFRIFSVLLVFVVIGLAVIKIGYGLGKSYPDIGSENKEGLKKMEKLIQLDYPPGNLAVAQNGHVYFNYHPLVRPNSFSDATVFEWADGKINPFPSMEMQKEFQGTFGMTIDKQNRIWFIEPATFDFKHTRIWSFDLVTKKKVHFYEFPEGVAKYAEELRVTDNGKYVLLANPGIFRFTSSKLLVYSVEDHSVRVAIDKAPSVQPENWIMHTIDGKPHRLMYGLLNFAVGIDGIEISDDQNWVFIASMTHSRLFRVPLSAVLNKTLTSSQVAKQIEDLGQKPMSDGITIDKTGNVIITDIEHGGLMSFDLKSRRASTLVRSKDIRWADGVAAGPDSSLYFTDSAIPAYIGEFASPPDKSVILKNRPYFIYRLNH